MDVKDSCVFYADWLEAAHTIENTALRCCFLEAVLQYALTGMEVETPPELKLAMTIVKNCIDRDRDKYQKKIEKRREAGRLGGYQKAANMANLANVANDSKNSKCQQKVANVADNVNDNVNGNVNDNVNDNDKDNDFKNNPPIPPRGGRFNFFKDYYIRVSEVKVPKRIEDIGYENQYVWRAAECTPGYIIEVDRMLKGNPTDDQAKMMMQTINAGYATMTEFRVLRLALEMKKLRTTDQRKAVLEELKRSEKEPDIFDTLLEKCEYINAGNKVNSLKGFMQSRRD